MSIHIKCTPAKRDSDDLQSLIWESGFKNSSFFQTHSRDSTDHNTTWPSRCSGGSLNIFFQFPTVHMLSIYVICSLNLTLFFNLKQKKMNILNAPFQYSNGKRKSWSRIEEIQTIPISSSVSVSGTGTGVELSSESGSVFENPDQDGGFDQISKSARNSRISRVSTLRQVITWFRKYLIRKRGVINEFNCALVLHKL